MKSNMLRISSILTPGLLTLALAACGGPDVDLENGDLNNFDAVAAYHELTLGQPHTINWEISTSSEDAEQATPVSYVVTELPSGTTYDLPLDFKEESNSVVAKGSFEVQPNESSTYKGKFTYVTDGKNKTANSSTLTVDTFPEYCGVDGVDGYHSNFELSAPSVSAGAAGWPVVILVHGGSWKKFSSLIMRDYVEILNDAGYWVLAEMAFQSGYALSKKKDPQGGPF